jgi:predicted nucleic acid-binding protein
MPGDIRRVYLDANVFLAFVSDEADRTPVVEEVLRKAQAKELGVLTSTVTIAEVAYGAEEKLHRALDAETESRIDGLWAPGGPVTLVEASRYVLVAARGLIRANLAAGNARLSPLDAIHLATAQIEHVAELHTYETNRHDQWSGLISLPVVEPSVPQPPLDFGSA